ncbi:MAG: hypothetical protein KatS3mg001_044 [Candidatus Pacearchaeota archaeon]|nr:MAG: hypothetical protein KatS3mg001_044 [Candidatus Pacearchaeota archaeon]
MTIYNLKSVSEKKFLEDIINENDLIIFDTSSFISGFLQDYEQRLFFVNSFHELNKNLMIEGINFLEFYLGFLQNQKTITVREVYEEMLKTREILSEKIRYLRKRDHKRKVKYHKKSEREIFFEEILELLNECCKEAKRSIVSLKQNEDYASLEKRVIEISELTHSKVSYAEFYPVKRIKPKKEKEELYTDEKIVALALYYCLFKRKNVGILTRDSDIKRITSNTLIYLLNENQLPLIGRISIYTFEDSTGSEEPLFIDLFNSNNFLKNHIKA